MMFMNFHFVANDLEIANNWACSIVKPIKKVEMIAKIFEITVEV